MTDIDNHLIPKVFCLGLHKTGTTSLARALESRGYQVASFFGTDDPFISQKAIEIAIEKMIRYDAAQDDPWYLLYRELDRAYPGSKFVLLTREKEDWFRSCLNYFGGDNTNHVREWFYGKGNSIPSQHLKDHWIKYHEDHEENVRKYFKGRDMDFIEMSICEGEGWEKLGPFLNIDFRCKSFPRLNTKYDRKRSKLNKIYLESSGLLKFILGMRMRYLNWRNRN